MHPRAAAALRAGLLAAAGPAAAQETDDRRAAARTMGEEAMALFDQGAYAEALAKFDRAEALVPVPTLGLRAARCLERLGRWVEAADRYLRASAMPIDPSLPDAYQQAQAQARTDALEARAALVPRIPRVRLTFEGERPDAVTIDGVPEPLPRLEDERAMDPGDHVVRATRAGVGVEERVHLGEGEGARIVLRWPVPVSVAAPAARLGTGAPADAAPPATSPLRTAGWISLAVGGLGIATGAVTLGLALDRQPSLDECPDRQCPAGGPDVSTYNTLAAVSPVAFVAGAIAAATGVVLLLVAPPPRRAARGSMTPIGRGEALIRF